MKEGWEIKKLGEVCDVLNGYAFKSSNYVDKGTRIIRITNVQKGVVVDEDPKYYSDEDMNGLNQFQLYENDLLMSLTGNVGRVGLLSKDLLPAALNQRVACLRVKDKSICLYYLFHYLNSSIFENEAILSSTGIAQKNMSTEWLKKHNIPIPPLSEQERIVGELDCLSGVIEKKKAQLKELDALAQSIFYEMFGNPVENDRGWEVKKFKDCYKLTSGKNLTAKQIVDGDYPVYGGNGIVGYHNDYNLDGDNIIIGRVGALCGNVRNVLGKSFITDNAFILTKLETGINVFVLYLLRIHDLRQYARDALQPVISNAGFQNIEIILPPLSLQQQFAEKIEKIEKQKELIRKSIEEVEMLFNSRMDYYFG
jgi:type I restriction enzyme S subunit